MEELWKEVLAEVEIEVSKPIFLTFFKPTVLVSLESSVATIDAPTHITAEYIEKRYYSLIKKILDKKTLQNVSLIFTSAGGAGKSRKSTEGPLFAKDITNIAQKARPQRIRPDFTFDSLAVSESNQLAYTAALTVASNPGTKYNPLFLYGTVGVGKTHLMNSIANKVFDEHPENKIIYLTTEEFTNEVVEAIRDKTTAHLRKKFRNVDILLLDDVQFLAGKERVQEELFHTFNTLVDKGHQVALSSDRPPSEIKKIEARLASRFEGGLTVDIEPPDFELRAAILLIKSKKYGLNLSYESAKAVAERIVDTRALEGFLLRLSSVVSGDARELQLDDVLPVLGKTKQAPSFLHPDNIIETICSFYNIKSTQLKGAKRDSFLVGPRHICMFLLKEETRMTFVEIGNLLGGRDHTTVMHAVDKIREMITLSEKTKEEIQFIKRKIKENLLE
ncbi:MAG: chromosomal replication initiator protein DnaA [Candidatus Levybacteria bacterium RIFCSPHIGHO2_02_FULL_39_36]|nr:MAG: Chromosomal replication initiator protein DnaA [Candidatus Levybacteria bacterium GW2011_GWA1_39_11]KKR49670.1 MAG: Chromosomal replication initiator protein DnaA [Candidatus Levybacteria bacterium GW2011_GWA2_40_16]OGH15173.1 MAG: chromosomal replication initiator protein DnaA [Candidatus Levybacteria bacterium RIFCSPHIGHO2_01_FULL_38_96]OGH25758.1 MAG: chromosomal replication initiator protein DnaA [Candidatus Levybacteria bacterium RIFCSPHIGHO2_12_FULL_39_39]OGH28192.1 MAG: chromosom